MRTTFRRVLSVLAVMVALVFASSTLYSAVMADAPDTVKIDKLKAKKAAVDMPHKKHVDGGIACKTCHHKATDGAKPKACSECHKAEKGDAPDGKSAFHKACQGCHKKEEKAGKKSGPTKCGDCHKG